MFQQFTGLCSRQETAVDHLAFVSVMLAVVVLVGCAHDLPTDGVSRIGPAVDLPATGSTEQCLEVVHDSAPDEAVRSALVLFCNDRTANSLSSEAALATAFSTIARIAYDPDRRRFASVRLAENIEVYVEQPGVQEFWFAGDDIQPIVVHESQRSPVGIPIVRRTPRDNDLVGAFYPPEGLFEPFLLTYSVDVIDNGTLRISLSSDHGCVASLRECARVAEAAYLKLLEAAELSEQSWIGFTEPQRMTQHTDGVYLIERYDPTRIPVLMIHGLQSSPLAWKELSQAILSDGHAHQRFQVWHAFYPTGLPPFYTASRVRLALRSALMAFDPGGDDVASRRMAVVGHSMGGVVSHLLVTNDEGRLWDATFTVPPETLPVAPDLLAEFRRIFSAEHESQIGFAAFIAAPHRGSQIASSLVGKIGSALVLLPSSFTSLFAADEAYLKYTTDAMYPLLSQGGPDSVRVLSPDHPLLGVLADLPVATGVDQVSVIGVLGGRACLVDPVCVPTDGVVPYRSSQFAPANDEIVIDDGHDVQRHPEAVRFVLDRLQAWQADLPDAARF